MAACCKRKANSTDDDELGEAAAKVASRSQAKLVWLSLALAAILMLTSLLVANGLVAAYLFVATAVAGGYFIEYCVQYLFLLTLQVPLLSANVKSALRVFDGPLLLAAWLSSIFMAAEIALPAHLTSDQISVWQQWLAYCFVLNAL